MSNFQIAVSGVTPGTFGNNSQIPTFTVDARGRITWAANVDIEQVLKTRLDDHTRTFDINVRTEELKFRSGRNISIIFNEEREYEISLIHDQLIRGSFEGQLTGPVLANDTSILVNPENKTFNGAVNTGGLTISNSSISAASNAVEVKSSSPEPLRIVSTINQESGTYVSLEVSKGTLSSPENTVAGALVGGYQIKGYHTNKYVIAGNIMAAWLPNADFDNDYPASAVLISAGSNDRTTMAGFTGGGVLSAPVLMAANRDWRNGGSAAPFADAAARDLAIPAPLAGMICYISDDGTGTPKFQGYKAGNVNAWVNLA